MQYLFAYPSQFIISQGVQQNDRFGIQSMAYGYHPVGLIVQVAVVFGKLRSNIRRLMYMALVEDLPCKVIMEIIVIVSTQMIIGMSFYYSAMIVVIYRGVEDL